MCQMVMMMMIDHYAAKCQYHHCHCLCLFWKNRNNILQEKRRPNGECLAEMSYQYSVHSIRSQCQSICEFVVCVCVRPDCTRSTLSTQRYDHRLARDAVAAPLNRVGRESVLDPYIEHLPKPNYTINIFRSRTYAVGAKITANARQLQSHPNGTNLMPE